MTPEEIERLERIYENAFGRKLLPEERRFLGLAHAREREEPIQQEVLPTKKKTA